MMLPVMFLYYGYFHVNSRCPLSQPLVGTLLAELHRQRGSRFVTFVGILGLSRESLRRTLAALLDGGLVGRNPGYGHPLRPEYVLASSGERIARRLPDRSSSDCATREPGGCRPSRSGRCRWFFALGEGPMTLLGAPRDTRGDLPRALTLALKDLEAAGLHRRRVTDDYPPATVYRLTRSGRPARRPPASGDSAADRGRTASPRRACADESRLGLSRGSSAGEASISGRQPARFRLPESVAVFVGMTIVILATPACADKDPGARGAVHLPGARTERAGVGRTDVHQLPEDEHAVGEHDAPDCGVRRTGPGRTDGLSGPASPRASVSRSQALPRCRCKC